MSYFDFFCLITHESLVLGQLSTNFKMDTQNLSKKIGEKFKALRTERGLTQEIIADKLDISVSAYAKLERAETEITVTKMEQIALLYGLKVLDLVTSESQPTYNFNNTNNHEVVYQGNFQQDVVTKEELAQLKTQVALLDIAIQRICTKLDGVEKKGKNI